jgi:hypothetical protein
MHQIVIHLCIARMISAMMFLLCKKWTDILTALYQGSDWDHQLYAIFNKGSKVSNQRLQI